MTLSFGRVLAVLITILLTRFGASYAQAQSDFAGFYGQLSTGYESNQLGSLSGSATEVPNNNSDIIRTAPSQTFSGTPLVFGAGYYWQANEKWLIGLGVDYSALSQTSSSFPVSITNASGNTTVAAGSTVTANGGSVQLSNRFNLFLTPGYAIDKDKLVYLKAGYSQVTTQFNRHSSVTRTAANGTSVTTPATGGSPSSNQGGYLVGLGYKQIITSGLYGFVEGNYMSYNSPSDSFTTTVTALNTVHGISSTGTRTVTTKFNSLNSYQLLVGMGYAF
jgi:outer membrane immunogenic protein